MKLSNGKLSFHGHATDVQGNARSSRPLTSSLAKIDRAVHAGMIPGKPRRREQFGMARRHPLSAAAAASSASFSTASRATRSPSGRRNALAMNADRLARPRQAQRFPGEFVQHRRRRLGLARQRPQHVEAHHIAGPSQIALTGDSR